MHVRKLFSIAVSAGWSFVLANKFPFQINSFSLNSVVDHAKLRWLLQIFDLFMVSDLKELQEVLLKIWRTKPNHILPT